jgi:AcrR family transcriptional regulator
MARTRARAPQNGGRSDADRIIDATLERIATVGWRDLSLAAIAEAARLPILRVYRAFPSKPAILAAFYGRIDEAVLAEPPAAEADERPRDRLFDLMMRRFDALREYRPALDVLRRELPGDPLAALCLGGLLLRSLGWMLDAAGIGTGGVAGAVRVKLAAAAYLSAMRVWLADDSADLGRTMATLDARLRRIERWLAPRGRRRREEERPAPA